MSSILISSKRQRDIMLVDIDGTISDCRHRLSLIKGDVKDYDAFHMASIDDPPHVAEGDLVRAWAGAGGTIVYCTSRNERYRALTVSWLRGQSLPIMYGHLLMRGNTDFRPSSTYKLATIREQKIFDRIALVLEDNDEIVKLFRNYGLTVLQPRGTQGG